MSRTLGPWYNVWMFLNPFYSRPGQLSSLHRSYDLPLVATLSANSWQWVKEDPTLSFPECEGPCGGRNNTSVRVSMRAEPLLCSGTSRKTTLPSLLCSYTGATWLGSDQWDLNRSDLMVWDGCYDAWCSGWKVGPMQFYASSPGGSFISASLGDVKEGELWRAMNLVGQGGHFMLKKKENYN